MSPISESVKSVVDLFTTSLADVKFGDVDGQSLTRAVAHVESASQVVASAQAALDAARITLREREEALLVEAQRALAYARVYAERDEVLSGQLEGISLPRSPRRPRDSNSEVPSASPDAQPANGTRVRAKRVAATSQREDGVAVNHA